MNTFFRAFLSLMLVFQLIATSSGGVMMALAQESQEVQEVEEVQESQEGEEVQGIEEVQDSQEGQEVQEAEEDQEGEDAEEVQDSQEAQEAESTETEEETETQATETSEEQETGTEESEEAESNETEEGGSEEGQEGEDTEEVQDSQEAQEAESTQAEEETETQATETSEEQETGTEESEEAKSGDQNGEIEQNVQDTEELEVPKKTEEELLEMLDKAFDEGTLKRGLPQQIALYLKNESVSEEMIAEILKRFPVQAQRAELKDGLKTETAVIPDYLLSRAKKATVTPGISTQGVQTSSLQSVPVEFVSERVLVKVKSKNVADQWMANADAEGLEIIVLQDEAQPLLRIDSKTKTSTIGLLQKYLADGNVVYQEPDYVYTTDVVPDDTLHSLAWQHNNTGAAYNGQTGNAGEDIQSHDAWDIFTGNGTAIIAVIDTGVMLNHPDLKNNLWNGTAACVDHNGTAISGGCPHSGYDYFDFDNNPSDESNHGTLVSGSAASQGNNAAGLAGVNWSGKIMAMKTGTAASNKLSGSAIVNSINFAVRNGAKVLNMSFSSSGESTSITNAITFARTNGALVIASAGNNAQDLDVQSAYPCETALDNIICIAATNVQGTLNFLGGSGGSNYGLASVDVSAPGTHIATTNAKHTDLYTNNFENGASDVADFSLTGGSGWGAKAGTNTVMTTHTGGSYTNSESTFAEINQTFDLSSYSSGTLLFEMSCVTDDTVDGSNNPVDGVGIDISTNGGTSFQQVYSFNGADTTSRGLFDTGPNGLPLITVGLVDTDFVSNFKFRFHFFSNSSLTGTGCDIDEVKLRVNNNTVSYVYATGTSFAAPITAGLASLIWEFKPTFTYDQVRDQIYAGGETLAALTGTTITGKRINSYRSLALLTDPAVVNLRGFLTNGGSEFSDAASISTTGPFFSWTAPTGKGIISGYSFAVDGVPDATVDTTGLNTTLSSLSQGAHTFQVFGVNDVGVTGTVAVFNFTVDTINPDAPTGVALNGSNVVNAGNVSSSSLTGTAAEAATLNYTISDGANPNVTGSQAVASGAFTINSINVSSLNEGSLTVSVTLTDTAGNVSSAGSAAVNKDTQVASATSVQLNSNNPITAATANSVNLTFDTTEAGSASYSVSDGVNPAVTGNVTVTGAGTTTQAVDHSSLNDTTLTISVTFTDSAGNAAAAANANLVKDTQVSSAASVQLNGGTSANAGNVSSSSLSFTTTEAGAASFSISDGANPAVTGTPTVTGAGTTTVNSLNLSSLNEGPLTVSVTFTDTVGNAAAATNLAASKDTQVAAVTNVKLNGGVTILASNHTAVDLSFTTVEAGNVTYSISDGVNPDVTGASVVFPAATMTLANLNVSSLNDGTLNLSVIFTDDAGNVASAGTGNVQKDVQIAAPTNVSLNGGTTINNATKTSVSLVFDTVEAGNVSFTVSDGVNPNVTGNTAVAGSGTTTVNSINVSSLNDGTLNISVIFTDTAGNVSGAGTATVAKDTQVSATTNVEIHGFDIINSTCHITGCELRGAVTEPGSLNYTVSDGVNPVINGSATVSGPGAYFSTLPDVSTLNEGSITFSIIFTDSVGNVSSATVVALTKDTIPPPLPTGVNVNGNNIINSVNVSSGTISGNASETGLLRLYYLDALGQSQTIQRNTHGTGPFTMTGIDFSNVPNGTQTFTIYFGDNQSNSNPTPILLSVEKDIVSPTAPTGIQLNGSVTINNTSKTSVSITGTAAEAGTVLYSIVDGANPAVAGSQVVASGAFTVAGLDVSSLNDGTLTVYVSLTDAAGNTSSSGNNTVSKDIQVASAAAVQLNGGALVTSLNQASSSLSFTTTESGSASYIVSDGVNPDVTGNVTVTGAGTTTVNSLDVTSLNQGNLSLSVTFTDTAGNAASAATGNAQKDSQVVAATSVQLNGGAVINGGNHTNVNLTFDTAEAGSATYSVSDGANPDVTGNVTVTGAGTTTVTGLDVSSLNNGTLNLSVVFTDSAGNVASAGTGNVQKDAQAPTAPTGIQLNGSVTINNTTKTSVSITGTVAEAGTVLYSIVDGANPAVAGSQAVASGAFTVAGLDVSSLNDGTLTVYVSLTDAAGNTSSSGNNTVSKDIQVASAAAVQLNGGTTIIAANQASVSLTFTTTEAGSASYTISDGVNPDVTGNVTVTGAGTTTVNTLNVSTLNDGTLNLSVVFTDSAGNASSAGTGNVQKDSTVNSAVNVQLNGGTTIVAASQSSVALTFDTNEAGTATYSISDGANPAVTGNATVTGAGTTTVNAIDVSALNDGTLNLSVIFTDAASNPTPAGTGNVQKDAQVAAAGSVQLNGGTTINNGNKTSVALTFTTAEAGTATFSVSDGVNPNVTGNTTVTGTGTTTVNGVDVSSLNDGTLNLSVIFTDTPGNVASAGTGNVSKDTQVATAGAVQLNGGTTINDASKASVALTFTTTEVGSASYSISDGVNPAVTGNVTVTGAGTTTVNSIDVSSLNDGTLNLSVVFTDSIGNAASAGTGNVQKDTQAPSAATGVQLNGGVAILAATAGSVNLTGTVAEAGTLDYSVSDGVNPAITGSQVIGSAGSFTVAGLDVSGLNDGTLTITTSLTDAVGNVSANGGATVQKDAQVAAAGSVQLNGGTTINNGNKASVALTFTTAEAGSVTFSISDGANPDVTGNATVSGAGTTTVNGVDVSSLNDGTLNLSVVFTDTPGNVASAGTGNVSKDAQVSIAGSVQLNGGTTINDASKASVDLAFTTTEAGSATYSISDGVNPDVTGNVTVTGAGTTAVNSIDVSSLNDGALTLSVVFTDTAGNAASAGTGSVQKDVSVITASTVQLNGGAGIAAAIQTSVNLTFDNTEAGSATYSISDGVNPNITGNVTVTGSGTTTVSAIDVSSLNDTTLNISVTFTDTAGNVAATGAGTVLKDTVAQAPAGLVLNNNQTIILASQSLVTFRVTVSELGTVNYFFSDGSNPNVTGSQAATSTGVVTVSNIDVTSLNEGSLNFQVSLTDSLGNVSTALSGTATKDTIVISAASVVLNANSPINGNSLTVVTLAFQAPELGSATYVITDQNNTTITAVVPVTSTGVVTISNIDVTTLADGPLIPAITFTDSSGNAAALSVGPAVQKTSTVTPVSGGGGRRRIVENDPVPTEDPVEVQPVTVSTSGGGGGGGGGSVLGAKTVDVDDEKEEELSEEKPFAMPFRDVKKTDEYYEAVKTLSQKGVVKGQGNASRFDPDGVLDRAQALKMLLMLAEIEIPESIKKSPFADVDLSAWFAPIISVAKEMGYVKGYADGSFVPWQILNRAEALVIAYRIMGIEVEFDGNSDYEDVAGDVWFADVLHDAVEKGLLSVRKENGQSYADPTADMTRAEFAVLIVGLMGGEGV